MDPLPPTPHPSLPRSDNGAFLVLSFTSKLNMVPRRMVCDRFSLSFSVNDSTKRSEDYAKSVTNCFPRTVLGVSQAFVKEAHFCVAASLASQRFSLSY